jgi:hypothetical protein
MMQARRPLHAASAAPDHCSPAWHSLLCPQALRLHACILRYCLASCVSTRPRNSPFPFPASQPPSVGPLVVEVSMQLGGTEEGLRWGHSTREGDNMLGDGSERGRTTEEKRTYTVGAPTTDRRSGARRGGLTQRAAARGGWCQ